MSGTRQPRKSTGRVYCGPSRVPWAKESWDAEFSSPKNAGDQARDGIDEDGGGEGAIGEDVVADGNLFFDEVVEDALVHALVVAAEQDEVAARGGVAGGECVVEAAAGGGEIDDAGGGGGGGGFEVPRWRRRWARIS